MAQRDAQNSVRATNYMLFIFGVSLLAVLNSLVLLVTYFLDLGGVIHEELAVLWAIDWVLAFILFFDFGMRFYAASKRADYFFRRGGWLDLIGSVPGLAIFRLIRMYRMLRAFGERGEHVIVEELKRARASGAMLLIVWLVLVVLEIAGVLVLWFESRALDPNITTASDALWWGYQTITTVGYGDNYPVTDAGRGVGYVLMTVGVGLFGTFTAWLANWFFGSEGILGIGGIAAEAKQVVQGQTEPSEED